MSEEYTWEEECMKWMGHVLDGKFAHYCFDWDGLPIDETCQEFTCCSCTFEDDTGRAEALQALRDAEQQYLDDVHST